MGGFAQRADLLAELVDLTGPARLVMFFAVLGEAGAFQRGGQLSVQVNVTRGDSRGRGGRSDRCGGGLEQSCVPGCR